MCVKPPAAVRIPLSERASFDPNMLLAYVAARRLPDAPPAPKFGTFIIEANMDGVEVFVDGQSAGVVSKGKPLRLPGLTPGRAHRKRGKDWDTNPTVLAKRSFIRDRTTPSASRS